jgi:hypothetical protein
VERPDVSPEPIFSTCIKPRDAKHDLFSQAVDGRLKGHVAISLDAFERGAMLLSRETPKASVRDVHAD